MKSISKYVVNGQVVSVGQYGIMSKRTGDVKLPSTCGISSAKRGKITGFSKAAARRLREFLWGRDIPDSAIIGITCTVPWKDDQMPPMDEFCDCVDRFGKRFRRAYPHSGMVFRVELQQRGAPHLHAIIHLHPLDFKIPGVGGAAILAGEHIADMWRGSVQDLHGGNWLAFDLHGVRVQRLQGITITGMMRYLCDHASKHKQSQLGYPGKQWGVINRSAYIDSHRMVLEFDTPHQEAVFWRMVGKLRRYAIKDPRAPFGCYYRGSRTRVGIVFLSGGGDIALRCYDWVLQNVPRGTY